MSATRISDLGIYRAIVEQAPDAMIFADSAGTILLWNASAEAIFGYPESEAIGQRLDLIIPENLRAAHWRSYDEAMTTGHTKLGGKALATRATHGNLLARRLTKDPIIVVFPVAFLGRRGSGGGSRRNL